MSSTSCAEPGCREQPSFSCSCSKSLFVCRSHIVEHLITPGSHTSTSLISLVPENQKQKVFSYLTFKRELVRQNLNELLKFSNELLKLVIDQTKKAQNKLFCR